MTILNSNFVLTVFLLQLSIISKTTLSVFVPTPPSSRSSSTDSPLILTTTSASEKSLAKLSPEIVNELKDFVDLIPTAVVDEIVAKHYIIDGNFRTALKYLRSTQFTQMLQQIQQIPEIIEIFDFLHLRVATTTATTAGHDGRPDNVESAWEQQHVNDACEMLPQLDMATMSMVNNNIANSRLEIVLLNTIEPSSSSSAMQAEYEKKSISLPATRNQLTKAAYNLSTFTTFVEELIEHLPRDRYMQMINEKRQKSAAFAQFYVALRSEKLRPMVDATMKCSNLAGVLRTLNSNKIDVNSLETIAFKVLSWGPPMVMVDHHQQHIFE